MVSAVFRRAYAHSGLKAAAKALVGIKAVSQRDLQDGAIRPCKLPGGQGDPAPCHVAHDTLPHRFPEQALVMISGKMQAIPVDAAVGVLYGEQGDGA